MVEEKANLTKKSYYKNKYSEKFNDCADQAYKPFIGKSQKDESSCICLCCSTS